MDKATALTRIESITGSRPASLRTLGGGCVGDVYTGRLPDGQQIVVKIGPPGAKLDVEGFMLRYLAEHSRLPVPAVIHDEDELLVMEFVESGESSAGADTHAADLLAELHELSADRYGLERDTLIGSLHQPNPWTDSWIAFFGQHRLIAMAETAKQRGSLDNRDVDRVRTLAPRLEEWFDEPAQPSLLHGDIWSGNVLTKGGRIAAFIDPAIYYGHPEIELAFITMFGTFGDEFFDRYHERRPIRDGFFEVRKDLYNLYPLLVHAALFGGGYILSVRSTLSRFGA